ncbi:hypothetical protein OSB04_011804 [Centaurea solstitialis]|uniref:Uncharacterized protein n=1 Tax=Centaurea solstitialis TaxID=347529 RepID=A0AA38TA55_9ASTR|nr:hypothetical protein OSB04_011804 [Centaurea solstitialis]
MPPLPQTVVWWWFVFVADAATTYGGAADTIKGVLVDYLANSNSEKQAGGTPLLAPVERVARPPPRITRKTNADLPPAGFWRRLIGLLLNIPRKSKDGVKFRKDMVEMGIRSKLAPVDNGKRTYLPPACYTLSMPVLDSWQKDVIMTLCQLEMYFPSSFFNVMVHLVSHIIGEIKFCGPVFLRHTYPFERYMGFLKGYVRNRYRPKGNIVEGYASEEVIDLYTNYLVGVKNIGILQSQHEENLTVVAPFVHEHMTMLDKMNEWKSDKWVVTEDNKTFATWIKERVKQDRRGENVDQVVEHLAYGLVHVVSTYQGCEINGYTFYTKKQDDKSTMQNSRVTLIATTTEFSKSNNEARLKIAKDSYYGIIHEIWELDYTLFKVPLFKCKWVENRRGVKVDNDGFTIVEWSKEGYVFEPFILAKQAS